MNQENYCRVTQSFFPTIQGPTGGIAGVARFTPLVDFGAVFQVEAGGGTSTVVAAPVMRPIVGGVLAPGEATPSGVSLFAGGPGANPSPVVWRVDYGNMSPVTVSGFNFEAVPGGSVDLAAVAPVAGSTPPGITRGEPGPRGEQGEQGPPGPPGEGGGGGGDLPKTGITTTTGGYRFAANDENPFTYQRYGDLVQIGGGITATGTISGVTISYLPEGYRPAKPLVLPVIFNETALRYASVSTDGRVSVAGRNEKDDTVIVADSTFITADPPPA